MTSVCEFKSINELKCSHEYLLTLLGGYGRMAQLHIPVIRRANCCTNSKGVESMSQY